MTSLSRAFYVPSAETHLIRSNHVEQVYQIQVMQPLMERGAIERFPVLFITDGNLFFDAAKSIAHSLQSIGKVKRFILVGIGYPGDNPFAGAVLRARDLTSHWYPTIANIPRTSAIEGVAGFEHGKSHWHGASQFLTFLRDELMPFVARTYPTSNGDYDYFGHSGGGGLGLHALFSQPALFTRYVISSPSISYEGDDFGIREALRFLQSRRPLKAKVFMSVGDQEEDELHLEKWQLVSSFCRLTEVLRRSALPGLELETEIVKGETHMSVWPISFSHGVQSIYGAAAGSPLD
jgi:uncharacterized protein